VIAVLVLAATFDLLSGDPVVHGLVLFAAAGALAWDAFAGRHGRAVPPGPRPEVLAPSPRLVLGGIVYAVVVGSFARYSWPASISVLVPGGAGVAAAWRGVWGRRPEERRPERAGVIAWVSLFVALSLWELTNLLLQRSLTEGSPDHPTFSVLMDPILSSHAGRSLFLALWLALGWFLLHR
jgi:hypothetical protein